MHTTWWVRAATIAAVGLATLVAGGTAWGDGIATLRSGQAPTTAAGFPTHSCDASFGGGPYADQDVWSFILPASTRQFITVTADFDITGDGVADTAISAPAAGGIGGPQGASKAWIVAPAEATLLTATAVTTGTASPNPDSFNINRTCPAAAAPSPSPNASGRSAAPGASPNAGTGTGTSKRPEPPTPRTLSGPGTLTDQGGLFSPEPAGGPESSPALGEDTGGGPGPGGASSTGDGGRSGVSGVAVAAALGSIAGLGALLMIVWRRRKPPVRPKSEGRHRLAADS